MITVYLIGAPGSGKSTVMKELTKYCSRLEYHTSAVPHEVLFKNSYIVGAEMGKTRSNFPGTDALSYSIGPKAVQWVSERPYQLLLGEGTRLATKAFLEAAQGAGELVLAYLGTSPELAASRRAERGSQQNEAWAKGATTRAANVAKNLRHLGTFVTLPGEAPPEILAEMMFDYVPELEALR